MFLGKVTYCSDCGKPHETGSLIFFECPLNGSWKSASDRCELHNKKFDNAGTATLAVSEKSVSIDLRDNPFSTPYFVSRKQLLELLDGRRKSCVIWMPEQHR